MSGGPTELRNRLVVAAFYLIAGIALLEIIFRVFVFPEWKSVSLATFVKHPFYGTFQKPNQVVRRFNPPNYDVVNRTNSLGFRDREEGFERDLSGIWSAGASNSYGGFVEDDQIYSALLQAQGYLTANLSSEGHRIDKQVRVIRHLASQGHRPRAVLVEMTLNNALGDYTQALKELAQPLPEPGVAETEKQAPTASVLLMDKLRSLRGLASVSWIGVKAKLINNSAFYCWLKVGINSVPWLRGWTLKVGLRADVAFADPAAPDLMEDIPGNPNEKLIDSTAEYAAAIQSWVGDNVDVPFAIVLIPSHHHLNKERFRRYREHLGRKEGELDPTRIHRRLLGELKKRNVMVLDMEPVLMANSDRMLSFPDDGHMNAAAHALVAREIFRRLPSLGLEPDQ